LDVVWFQIFDKSEGPVCFPKAGFSLIYQQRLGQPMNPGLDGNEFRSTFARLSINTIAPRHRATLSERFAFPS
jgi:hypothetical protein